MAVFGFAEVVLATCVTWLPARRSEEAGDERRGACSDGEREEISTRVGWRAWSQEHRKWRVSSVARVTSVRPTVGIGVFAIANL